MRRALLCFLPSFCRVGEADAQQQHHHHHHQQAMSGGRWAARPAPFTAAQYEELEHQALIYKYLVAGVPVPQDLLLPIRRGFVYHQPARKRAALPTSAPLVPSCARSFCIARAAVASSAVFHTLDLVVYSDRGSQVSSNSVC